MDEEGRDKVLRAVILVAIVAIVGLAVMGGLYGWYLYKTIGTHRGDLNGSSSAPAPDSRGMQAILKTLTPTSGKSMLTPEEEASARASLSAPTGGAAHKVDQTTLDSLTPPATSSATQ